MCRVSSSSRVGKERPAPNTMFLVEDLPQCGFERLTYDVQLVSRVIDQEIRNGLGMITTKPCSETVGTNLSILPMKARFIKGADEPIRRLFQRKCGQLGPELGVVTTPVSRCLRPPLPLVFPHLLIVGPVKTSYLTVFVIMAANGEVCGHIWRS